MTLSARAIAAIEAAFEEAVKDRFVTWAHNVGDPGAIEGFIDGIYKLNEAREKIVAELGRLEAKE